MVDFKKRLRKEPTEKPVFPAEIYEKLDRASNKGPLRPVQSTVLKDWYESYRDKRDVILKLNTGQGKTLIGLLILQSKLNQGEGRALYLCPNNFLVNQTFFEAKQFGVGCITATDELPDEFLDGKSILITSVQKLFNGLSKFGVGARSLEVPNLLMDDAHTCIEAIRDACVIRLNHSDNAYSEILNLFDTSLKDQGVGTYADIKRKDYGAFLPIPYWDWIDRHVEVSEILSKYSAQREIKFAWPLLKDIIKDCLCVISGTSLEILPYLPPLHMFGSYYRARHRVFMSATVTDDSFLIKGLEISEETINQPLIFKDEKWSGEKMILIPSLIDSSLSREIIVETFAKPMPKRKYAVVILSPSFGSCRDWEGYSSVIANTEDIESRIQNLKNKEWEKALVIVNRYDGIDLPDDSCRVLILDSKPRPETLIDKYIEICRRSSEIIATKTARTIEQGMGRAVRGEKDYCVVILIGTELIKAVRTKEARKYFSTQTQTQIDIGIEIANLAKDEIAEGVKPLKAFMNLMVQCLNRDEGWKEFYVERMDEVPPSKINPKILYIFSAELQAESKFQKGVPDDAVNIIQKLIDDSITDDAEKGWYLQDIARYLYPKSKNESNKYQIHAHQKNRYLLKPKTGMEIAKVATTSQKRLENIIGWIKKYQTFEDLSIGIDEILGNLRFGVASEQFEKAFNDLAEALGFKGERPDKEWKAGPDNLWALRDSEYLLVECKSEVDLNRAEIGKHETGQMNNSCAWFKQNYGTPKVKKIMIIPARKIGYGAGFNEEVEIMRKEHLSKLTSNVRRFLNEFKNLDLENLSERKIQELLNLHQLSVENILTDYCVKPIVS
ncbi:MAG: DEAD/DEAH box helicase family protein [Nitrospirae bacterium]|nr:DEAD/DEAH box helicase family protein [Nitrospirota bacterium]